jgi:hypothetical protein
MSSSLRIYDKKKEIQGKQKNESKKKLRHLLPIGPCSKFFWPLIHFQIKSVPSLKRLNIEDSKLFNNLDISERWES